MPADTATPHELPPTLKPAEGPGGLPFIQVANAHATACISVHGGQVLAFRPSGVAQDLLFVSTQATHQHGKAIRGGVPVCWPWFGPDPKGLGRPSHGFARNRLWQWRHAVDLPDGRTQVDLVLRDSAETRARWPHAFELSLTVTVGASLGLALTTRNTGGAPFEITQALHSYFAVGDIARTAVTGLDGCAYIDKATGAGGVRQRQTGDLVVNAEVDRIYTGVPAELCIVDPTLSRTIRIRSEGCRTAVVWNPWATLAAGMADLADDEYRRFLCVETANAADDAITLPPGAEHRLAVQLSV